MDQGVMGQTVCFSACSPTSSLSRSSTFPISQMATICQLFLRCMTHVGISPTSSDSRRHRLHSCRMKLCVPGTLIQYSEFSVGSDLPAENSWCMRGTYSAFVACVVTLVKARWGDEKRDSGPESSVMTSLWCLLGPEAYTR